MHGSIGCLVCAQLLSGACLLPELTLRETDEKRATAGSGAVSGLPRTPQRPAAGAVAATNPVTTMMAGSSGARGGAAGNAADACAVNNGGCDTTPMAICARQTDGTARCSCPSGYTGNGVGAAGCNDFDDCQTNNGGCDDAPMAKCNNQVGRARTCTCPAGSSGTGIGANGCTPMRFTITASTVGDTTTGLTWQRTIPATYSPTCTATLEDTNVGETCSWPEARAYCTGLVLAGTGWRIPTLTELTSIVDETQEDGIDPVAFPNTPTNGNFGGYWTATAGAPTNGMPSRWVVFFGFGDASIEVHEAAGMHVRCVR